ncbi:MAG: pyridoxal-phosphate dependent enzyme, partial [Planctomycetota bacterium]
DRWVREAAARLEGVVERTRLLASDAGDPRIELRLKLENEQVTGAFKARGAWNSVVQLEPAERAAGVATASSGNHGKALAWAAERAGVRATVCMPANSYPSKIEAARAHGAEVVLTPDRRAANAEFARRVEAGATAVPPYDARRTVEGQGTVALEVFEQWPECEVLVAPIGGGGLLAGCSLVCAADAARTGRPRRAIGVEPSGAATTTSGLVAGRPVEHERVDSRIQGLTPPFAGALPLAIIGRLAHAVGLMDDGPILEAQARLVRELGLVVEPAGAITTAWVAGGGLSAALLAARSAADPLRVCAIVSGGNPDPAQLAAIQAG